ncbi:NERD domain-containing protein [Fulvivirgaceae bacterium BMA12]|uniref:NERD domain-containing protein n=1 Tax=Agaribacillus aureus TaxID=3051825 RepID=A0ABT8LFJ1_9BACT|nr:NERD domain-containing protein [Fulvivirgaceae bacterium BMA12]
MNANLILILIAIFVVYKIVIFVYRLNAPKIKGAKGESRVARRLEKLKSEEYNVFNDVLIRTDSRSSQIDHIVISIYGIFVIETKNYSGWIHGHENSEYWTQTIYRNKTKFRNPIRQNRGHIYALNEVFSDFKQVVYHPIIVFSGKAKLKNVYSEIPVIYGRQLLRTIKKKRGTLNLSIDEVNSITDKLNEVRIHGKREKKEHIRQVRNHIYERKQNEKSSNCPRCGGNLVVRQGQFGNFYGCSNYPKCRYTKKI